MEYVQMVQHKHLYQTQNYKPYKSFNKYLHYNVANESFACCSI